MEVFWINWCFAVAKIQFQGKILGKSCGNQSKHWANFDKNFQNGQFCTCQNVRGNTASDECFHCKAKL